jgi:cardiolipin synthase (CMP-forming)
MCEVNVLVWLAVIILGRDFGLGIAALYYRYISLPPPKTFSRYWDFSLPSAEVHPTNISKVFPPTRTIVDSV